VGVGSQDFEFSRENGKLSKKICPTIVEFENERSTVSKERQIHAPNGKTALIGEGANSQENQATFKMSANSVTGKSQLTLQQAALVRANLSHNSESNHDHSQIARH
jgi:hypothetical protein